MKKRERVERALAGQPADRPPVSAWYHFGLQHARGDRLAAATIEFSRAYDWDFIKVMNDYSFPLPAGCEAVASERDWEGFASGLSEPLWPEQLRALGIIRREAGEEAPVLETIFSPWTIARRSAGIHGLLRACEEYPDTLLKAMERIAQHLAAHIRDAIRQGIDGVFLSLAASRETLSEEAYLRFCKPFDLLVLNAGSDLWFNVLHLHGSSLHFDLTLDYPAQAWNWSHLHTAPAISDGKRKAARAVLGGIDEQGFSRATIPEIRRQVQNAVLEAGPAGLLICPGCSVPSDSPVRNLASLSSAVKELAGQTRIQRLPGTRPSSERE